MPVDLASRVEPNEYGWKAHYLGLLNELGYATPHSVAFGIHERVQVGDVSPDTAKSFAVRSSALSEDTFEHSNAGSFVTQLEVKWADLSAASHVVRASSKGEPIGVVVQAFVQPQISGVAFSMEPTTYAYESWMVSWVEGTGDGLVSGRRNGNDVLFGRRTGEIQVGHWCGREDIATEIGATLSHLAGILNGPVDIEWCVDESGSLVILQVRPVVLPRAAVVELDSVQAFRQLPGVVLGHAKIALRRSAAELGVAMTPSRVTIATAREQVVQPPVPSRPEIAGSSVVLLHPFTVDHRVVREFAKVDHTDVEFFTAECRRYSIRNYPTFESIAATEVQVANRGLEFAAVAVVLEQEIWDAELTGIIRRIRGGYVIEVGMGHFIPKGYVETSAYIVDSDGSVQSRQEVSQSISYHFVNGHVLREEEPSGNSWLTDEQAASIVDSLEPLLETVPGLALEFGLTTRGVGGSVYLIDAAESDDLGIVLERDALADGVVSHGRAVGVVVDLRRGDTAEDLDAHLYQSVIGEGPTEPTIFVARRAAVDLLPLLYACPEGCGFLFEKASLLAHFSVVLRERAVPAAIVKAADLDCLIGHVVLLDTSRKPPVTLATEAL